MEPEPAAKGQVIIQCALVVPQGGTAEQDKQIVELRLCAGVGVCLRRTICAEHPVGARCLIIGKAGGAPGAEMHLHPCSFLRLRFRQMWFCPLRQQRRQRRRDRAGIGILRSRAG